MYVATVEVATRDEVDRDEAMKLLGDYRPVLGVSSRGWVEIQLTFASTGLAHACTQAAAIARASTGAESIACEVMTEHEYIARRGLESGSVSLGRHAAYGDTQLTLPRQTTAADAT